MCRPMCNESNLQPHLNKLTQSAYGEGSVHSCMRRDCSRHVRSEGERGVVSCFSTLLTVHRRSTEREVYINSVAVTCVCAFSVRPGAG